MARETVIKMTQSLGPSYVPYVVKEMKDALTKGYQVWMCACVHACVHVFQVSVATALVC